APIPQSRKRSRSNLAFLDVYREPGVKVQVQRDGEWLAATTLELVEDAPTRIKVMVRMENDDSEKIVNMGRIILADKRYEKTAGRMPRGRSRSKDRDGTDWARDKGKTDKELVEEMRRIDRDKAVCASGKEYARKPVGYKAACALPREQGAASHRLMEEETFVPMSKGKRKSPSPGREEASRKAPSQEHQIRMQQLFEKYGTARGAGGGNGGGDVEGPDVLRFG
ncbi:unnamed protein product, partial [Polarella glacialis]